LSIETSDVSINISKPWALLALDGWKLEVPAVVCKPQVFSNGPRESNNSCNKENVMKFT
jgi:hypothetical protein